MLNTGTLPAGRYDDACDHKRAPLEINTGYKVCLNKDMKYWEYTINGPIFIILCSTYM